MNPGPRPGGGGDPRLDRPEAPLVRFGLVEDIFNICRAASIWPLGFGIACCAIEMMATSMSRYDTDRFGIFFRGTPRQADVMIVAGTIAKKFAPSIRRLYEQMPAPKWVLAMGNCAISGGPFAYDGQYAIVDGADKFLPVDIYIPGCPPRPEALLTGFLELQEKITADIKPPFNYFEPKYERIAKNVKVVEPRDL
jgi:NADH-quinone oxidoreductase subunit B